MRLELEPTTGSIPVAQDSVPGAAHGASEAQEALREGIKAAQAGDRRRARRHLLRAVELDPRSESGWLWLASISEFPEELLAFLDNVLEINAENARALEWRSATCSLMAKTFVQRGIDAVAENRHDFASECFNKALEYDKRNAMAWLWLASISDSGEGKIKCLERVLDIEPENRDALSALYAAKIDAIMKLLDRAKAAAVAGLRGDALEIIDAVVSQTPDCTDAWILKSHLVESFEEKIRCYDNILAYDPDNLAAVSGRETVLAIVGTSVEGSEESGYAAELSSADAETVLDNVRASDSYSPEYEQRTGESDSPEDTWHDHVSEFAAEPATVERNDAPVTPEPVNIEENGSTAPGGDSFVPPAVLAYDASEAVVAESEWSADPDVTVPEYTFEEFAQTNLTGDGAKPASDAFKEERPSQTCEAAVADEKNDVGAPSAACPFCGFESDSQVIACGRCRAVLTLSDLEMLLAHHSADTAVIREAVERMEIERTERDFNERGLTILGIGHLNLGNFESGYSCLFDASRLNPNNVVLERQVNSLLIRLEEIKQQHEAHCQMVRGKTILVVDDSPTVRKLIAGKLEKCGHEVYCSNDGVEAMDYLKSLNPDLVLLDITMPRMDGYQVCKLIRDNPVTKDVPVVMISGKDGFFDKARGRMAGATGYITKPFGPETLMKTVEHYLSSQEQEFE